MAAVRADASVLCHPGSGLLSKAEQGTSKLQPPPLLPLAFLGLRAVLPTVPWIVSLCFNPLCMSALKLSAPSAEDKPVFISLLSLMFFSRLLASLGPLFPQELMQDLQHGGF